jgi:hypothetical protein
LALVASLLLHGSLLGGLEWRLPQRAPSSEPSAFDVKLVAASPPTSAEAASLPPRTPSPLSRPAETAPPPVQPVTHLPEPQAEPSSEAAAPAEPEATLASPAMLPDAAPVEPIAVAAPPILNALPPRLDLRFQVRYGLAAGEQTLVWVNEGEHYTLTSVASASGLAGVFYRGRFVQTSRGRITPSGLQPEAFWDQRGDKHSSARFDAAAGRLTLHPAKGAPRHFAYEGEVQDALSLFFQLALTAPPSDGTLGYQVFNGKKLRDYAYEVRGEETLDTALGALRTLHLSRVADRDGRFEAWLAIDRHYLPVRVLRSDDKGGEMELRVLSIAP